MPFVAGEFFLELSDGIRLLVRFCSEILLFDGFGSSLRAAVFFFVFVVTGNSIY